MGIGSAILIQMNEGELAAAECRAQVDSGL